MRNGLIAGVRSRFQNIKGRLHRHPVDRVEHQGAPLTHIAAHIDKTPQGVGLERGNQTTGPASQRARLETGCILQLPRYLQQVPDDHLIVGLCSTGLIDGARHSGRLDWN